MKGIIVGYEPIDYVSKKTNQPVKGATIYMNCMSSNAFGYVGKSEFISESSPIFNRAIRPLLDKFLTRAARFTAQRLRLIMMSPTVVEEHSQQLPTLRSHFPRNPRRKVHNHERGNGDHHNVY